MNNLDKGIAALKTYVESQFGWEASFVPESAYLAGVTDIINAAATSKDQTPAGRQTAAEVALKKALNSTGQGGMVSEQQCHDGTAVVLKAIV